MNWGHSWVVLGVIVELPFRPGHYFCLPILFRLYLNKKKAVKQVEFVNSAGLGALFQLVQRLRQRGGMLALANVPPNLVRLFRAVGLARVARISDSVESALDLLESSPPGPLRDIENRSNES